MVFAIASATAGDHKKSGQQVVYDRLRNSFAALLCGVITWLFVSSYFNLEIDQSHAILPLAEFYSLSLPPYTSRWIVLLSPARQRSRISFWSYLPVCMCDCAV